MSSRLDLLAFFEEEQHAVVGFGRAEAVDAGDGGDDDAVAAFEEGARGGEAELVELLVDGGFLLDVEVAGGDVGFGLVVVVVGDEVLDGVVGEEGFELVVELGGEGLVVREDEGGALDLLDDLGHGEGLAGAGDAEQDLILFAGGEAGDEFARWRGAGRPGACRWWRAESPYLYRIAKGGFQVHRSRFEVDMRGEGGNDGACG